MRAYIVPIAMLVMFLCVGAGASLLNANIKERGCLQHREWLQGDC